MDLCIRKVADSEDHFAQSFALQYISLILFILIFSISAFLPKEKLSVALENTSNTLEGGEKKNSFRPLPISEKHIALVNKGRVNTGELEPYFKILTSHDVHLIISVPWNSSTGWYASREEAKLIQGAFVKNAVPPDAYAVEVTRSEEHTPRLRLFEGDSAWQVQ